MIVSGYVTQIIPPKDHGKYFTGYSASMIRTARGKYLVNVVDVHIPERFLDRLHFWWKHRRDKKTWYWTLVMDDCPYHTGELIAVDVGPFLPSVKLWTPLSEKEK